MAVVIRTDENDFHKELVQILSSKLSILSISVCTVKGRLRSSALEKPLTMTLRALSLVSPLAIKYSRASSEILPIAAS